MDRYQELNPYTNPGDYSRSNTLDLPIFLGNRLIGKVLDLASGETNQFAGIIPENNIVHVDYKQTPLNRMVQADAGKLPFGEETFDSVYLGAPLDDSNAHQFLKEMLRVVKKNGILLLNPIADQNSIFTILNIIRDFGIPQHNIELEVNQGTLSHHNLPLKLELPPQIYVTVQIQ